MTPEDSLAALIGIVGAPERPPMSHDWEAFARRNGFEAPPDYQLFIDTFGWCGIGRYETTGPEMILFDPFDPHESLLDQSDWDRRNMRGLRAQFPDQEPQWPIWPEPGGMIPWATSIDSELFGWRSVGSPSQWGTLVWDDSAEGVEPQRSGMVEYLVWRLQGGDDWAQPGDTFRVVPFERNPEPRRFRPAGIELTVEMSGASTRADTNVVPLRPSFPPPGSDMQSFVDFAHKAAAAAVSATSEERSEWDAWAADAKAAGVRTDEVPGFSWMAGQVELRFSLRFEPDASDSARRLVVDLARRLGYSITDVRDLEYQRWWPDL